MGTADFVEAVNRASLYGDAPSVPTVEAETVGLLVEDHLIADVKGTPPGEPGYLPTYSVELAVAAIYDLKAARATGQQTTSFTSEGSSVSRTVIDPAAFRALARQWRAKAVGDGGELTVIDLRDDEGRPHPRSSYMGETPNEPWWWHDVD